MADMNRVWQGTRTYMMSGRTNPNPGSFVSTLKSLSLLESEKEWLIQQVLAWPGSASVAHQVANDIRQA